MRRACFCGGLATDARERNGWTTRAISGTSERACATALMAPPYVMKRGFESRDEGESGQIWNRFALVFACFMFVEKESLPSMVFFWDDSESPSIAKRSGVVPPLLSPVAIGARMCRRERLYPSDSEIPSRFSTGLFAEPYGQLPYQPVSMVY